MSERCTIRVTTFCATSSLLIRAMTLSFHNHCAVRRHTAAWLSRLSYTVQGQPGMNLSSSFCLPSQERCVLVWWPVAMVTDAHICNYVLSVSWHGKQESGSQGPLKPMVLITGWDSEKQLCTVLLQRSSLLVTLFFKKLVTLCKPSGTLYWPSVGRKTCPDGRVSTCELSCSTKERMMLSGCLAPW